VVRLASMRGLSGARRGYSHQKNKKKGIFHTENILEPDSGIPLAFISVVFRDLHNRNRREAKETH
jgi:hypothetical protein